MIQKGFDVIQKSDIDALVTNAIMESRTLEYKQELPGNADADKKEFLADVSSFANAGGGDLLYGVKAKVDADGKKTGEPESITPLTEATPDEAKLRLEEMIRQGVEPRMRVQVKEIIGWGDDGRGFVVFIRVPKSFSSPHMVTFKNTSRFYSRNSAGKYQLDVTEIRSAVLATDSQADRIKSFREERLGRIIADETPMRMSSPHRIVLHIIPLPSFLNRSRLNLKAVFDLSAKFRPLMAHGWTHRFNLDGFLTWDQDDPDSGCVDSYCQLFFDGSIETVSSDLLRTQDGAKVNGGTGAIASVAYEQYTIAAVKSYFEGYAALGVESPVDLSMALLGCRGSYMAVSPRYIMGRGVHPIDRDVVILPDVIAENLDADIPMVMKPLFDSIWNACGFAGSFNYDDEGNWNPK